jgi:hypothetical protein
MIKMIGLLFIILCITLLYASFQKIYYDDSANNLESMENTYAITDEIGVEYFVKDNYQFIPDQVLVVMISLLIWGIIYFFSKEFIILSNSKISVSNLIVGILFLCIFIFMIINHKGTYIFFHDRRLLIVAGSMTLLFFTLLNRTWKLLPGKVIVFIILIFAYFQIGISVITELGNYFEPFVHEGEWGQIDGNFIVIFWNDSFSHSWTIGYSVFRVSNIFLLLNCFNLAVRTKEYLS